LAVELLAGKSVLVVEDDAATREALTLFLEREGYRVVAAPDGRQALERLRGPVTPDLILLDLSMPVMDGWRFREEQRRDPSLADVPVVLVCRWATWGRPPRPWPPPATWPSRSRPGG
jgi:CheY-like chemotaxis protein